MPRRATVLVRSGLSILLLTSIATGCAIHGLAFRDHHWIHIQSPSARAVVTLPVTVKWNVKPTVGAKSFALFVDRSPPPPGKGLAYFRIDDRSEIYTSATTTYVLDAVNPVASTAPSERNKHELTIVPLDSRGRRIGEIAATVEFTVRT